MGRQVYWRELVLLWCYWFRYWENDHIGGGVPFDHRELQQSEDSRMHALEYRR